MQSPTSVAGWSTTSSSSTRRPGTSWRRAAGPRPPPSSSWSSGRRPEGSPSACPPPTAPSPLSCRRCSPTCSRTPPSTPPATLRSWPSPGPSVEQLAMAAAAVDVLLVLHGGLGRRLLACVGDRLNLGGRPVEPGVLASTEVLHRVLVRRVCGPPVLLLQRVGQVASSGRKPSTMVQARSAFLALRSSTSSASSSSSSP